MHLRARLSNAFLRSVTFTWPMLSNVWVQCVLFSQLKCKIVLKNLTCKWIFNFWKINKKLGKCALRENAIIFLSIKFTHYSSKAVFATFYFLCNIRIGPMSYKSIFGRLFQPNLMFVEGQEPTLVWSTREVFHSGSSSLTYKLND